MSTGFDLSNVKQQAEEHLQVLIKEEEEVLAKLKAVQEQKAEIETFLGVKTSPRRRRYRTAIQEFFESSTTKIEITVADLIDKLFEGDASVTQGVKVSMARFAKDTEAYTYDSATGLITYDPAANKKAPANDKSQAPAKGKAKK